MEALTTLLWATQCFITDMERKKQHVSRPKLDVATVDVRRLSWELAVLFQQREIRMARRRVSFVEKGWTGERGLGRRSKALG